LATLVAELEEQVAVEDVDVDDDDDDEGEGVAASLNLKSVGLPKRTPRDASAAATEETPTVRQ